MLVRMAAMPSGRVDMTPLGADRREMPCRQAWMWPGKRVAIGQYALDVVSVAERAVEIKVVR